MVAQRRRFESWGSTPPPSRTAGLGPRGASRYLSLCGSPDLFGGERPLLRGLSRRDAGLRRLWKLPGGRLSTSVYAAEEARRNLSNPGRQSDLEELLGSVELVPTTAPTDHPLLSALELSAKD